MLKAFDAKAVAPPFSRYAHGVEVAADTRLLFISGQPGIRPDGTLPDSEAGQHAQAWANILAILAEAGMGPRDLVEVTVYITTRSGVPIYRAERDRALAGHLCASTLVIAAGLANVDWLVEIAAVAGKHS